MHRKSFALIAVLFIVFSCNKDKLETRPSIQLKSINGTRFEPNQNNPIIITMEFADSEGDLGGGTIQYFRKRLNVTYPVINPLEQEATYSIPDFPDKQRGEIELMITADRLNENPQRNDTVVWRIIVADRAGNVSDTIETPVLHDINE